MAEPHDFTPPLDQERFIPIFPHESWRCGMCGKFLQYTDQSILAGTVTLYHGGGINTCAEAGRKFLLEVPIYSAKQINK